MAYILDRVTLPWRRRALYRRLARIVPSKRGVVAAGYLFWPLDPRD
jgi:hypothetical protein